MATLLSFAPCCSPELIHAPILRNDEDYVMDAELVLASYWKQRIGRGRRDDATVLEEVENGMV